jgi:hypothetical protein
LVGGGICGGGICGGGICRYATTIVGGVWVVGGVSGVALEPQKPGTHCGAGDETLVDAGAQFRDVGVAGICGGVAAAAGRGRRQAGALASPDRLRVLRLYAP